MRKAILFIIFTLACVLFAQPRQVSFEDARLIADRNARAVCEANLSPAEAIPYYGPDGEINAWHFNYAINKAFPDPEQLKLSCDQAQEAGKRKEGNGDDEYFNIVVGANRGMPVAIEYSKRLSNHFTLGKKLERFAAEQFPGGYEIGKTYYLGYTNVWHEIISDGSVKYLNMLPYPKIFTEEEYQAKLSNMTFFWDRDDFEEDWEYMLDNANTMNRAVYMIPGEEHMPYYEWNLGCTPTAGAMLFAWWDHYLGFGKLVQKHATVWDPVIGRYTHHVPNIQSLLASTMDTDSEGSTMRWNICDGMIDAAEAIGYNCASDGLWAIHHTVSTLFDGIRNSVDNGRPLLTSIDEHSITTVGYGTVPSRFFVHDSNHSSLQVLSRSMLEGYYWVALEPINDVHYLEIDSPNGGTEWNSNYGGELLVSGTYYDITWSSTLGPNTYAKIYYHDEGGWTTDRWFPITAYTPNDGHYRWLVPELVDCYLGITSDHSRVKIEVYDSSTNQLLAADGSYGNFTISGDYVMPYLTSSPMYISQSNSYCRASHNMPDQWGIVAYRGTDCDLELYQAPDFNNLLITSPSHFSMNYILINNYELPPHLYGVKFASEDPDLLLRAMFRTDFNTEINLGTTYNYSWTMSDVAKLAKIYLTPGQYVFSMGSVSGVMDLDIALFPPGQSLYSYDQAVAYSRTDMSTIETFIYTVTQAGYYALAVSSAYLSSGEYSLRVDAAGKWRGTANTNWFNPANWVGNLVPTFTNDVVIPSGCTFYPQIVAGTYPEIKSISIESGASLHIGATEMNVHQNMQVYGNLYMTSHDSILSVGGNLVWGAGSALISVSNYHIYCYRNWDFSIGSNVQLVTGTVVFWGDTDSYITTGSSVSRFNNVTINKIAAGRAAIHSSHSSSDWRADGMFIIANSNSYLKSESNKRIMVFNTFTNNGHIRLDNGALSISVNTLMPVLNAGDYVNDIIFNTGLVRTLPSNYLVKGNLTINSGGINAGNRTLELRGDFINLEGASGFVKGTSTVVFNGSGDQRCTNGNFYRMEIANEFANVIFTGNGASSSCDIYDWIAGSLELEQGSLTILDLADNGLFGTYRLSGGTLNVYQDNSQYTDLSGEIYIYSGTMNVYGGNGNSYWPYSANARLEMHGGVLDFKNRGINVYNTSAYSLVTDINAGIIRTAGSFLCYRPDFYADTDSFIELYGATDANIFLQTNVIIHNLIFNKGAARTETCPPGLDLITRDGEEPTLEPELRSSNSTRANTVNLTSNVYIFGDLIVDSGMVNLNGYTLTTESNMDMSGTLVMNNEDDRLVVYENLHWNEGASASVTWGSIDLYSSLYIAENADFVLANENTVNFFGAANQASIYNQSDNCVFNSVYIERTGGSLHTQNSQPITIVYGLTVSSNSALYANTEITAGSLTVVYGGTLFQSGNITVSGPITFQGDALLSNCTLTGSNNFFLYGEMTMNNATCTLDRPYAGVYYHIGGALSLNQSSFIAVHNGINFGTGSSYSSTGGTLKTGWNFNAPTPGGFQPAGGTVELNGARNASILCDASNYFHHLVINKPAAAYTVTTSDALLLNGSLSVYGGTFSPASGLGIYGSLIVTPDAGLNVSGAALSLLGSAAVLLEAYEPLTISTFTINKTGGGSVDMYADLVLNGSTQMNITAGEFRINDYLCSIGGTIAVSGGGRLVLTSASILDLADQSSLSFAGTNTSNRGSFVALATAVSPALITSSTGFYSLSFNSHGEMKADYCIFEKMDANGITFNPRSYLNVEYPMSNCTFRDGQSGGALIRYLNNATANLTIANASFPRNNHGGLYNVSKPGSTGSLTFTNASGSFSGSAHENDPTNTIHWQTMGPPAIPQNLSIVISGSTVTLAWNASAGAASYLIYRRETPDGAWGTHIGTATGTTWVDNAPPASGKAFYRITAQN